MGNNLSNPSLWPDTSLDVLHPPDVNALHILAVAWGGSLYVIAMIFCTCSLIDRWRGPPPEKPTTFGTVLGAFILSLLWPLVFIGIMWSG